MVQKETPTSAEARASASAAIAAADQIPDGGEEVDEEKQEGYPCRWQVVVEDALHVAHGGFRGRDEHGLAEAVAKQQER